MPWKGEKDPYKIWLSEIILQQTRVEQGLNIIKNLSPLFPEVERSGKGIRDKWFSNYGKDLVIIRDAET